MPSISSMRSAAGAVGAPQTAAVAEAAGLPCVISSALETSVGLAAQLALAGALPQLDHACGLGTLSLLRGDTVLLRR
jgi:O-succinylbenzoate synthase